MTAQQFFRLIVSSQFCTAAAYQCAISDLFSRKVILSALPVCQMFAIFPFNLYEAIVPGYMSIRMWVYDEMYPDHGLAQVKTIIIL